MKKIKSLLIIILISFLCLELSSAALSTKIYTHYPKIPLNGIQPSMPSWSFDIPKPSGSTIYLISVNGQWWADVQKEATDTCKTAIYASNNILTAWKTVPHDGGTYFFNFKNINYLGNYDYKITMDKNTGCLAVVFDFLSVSYKLSCAQVNTDWSECNSTGQQTRINECMPEVRSCTPECTEVSEWTDGECISPGIRYKEPLSYIPTGCEGGIKPASSITEDCDFEAPLCTNIIYSDWSICNSSGKKTRTIISTTPTICEGEYQLIADCEPIKSCADITNQTICETTTEETLNLSRNYLSFIYPEIANKCGEEESDYIIDCFCSWEDNECIGEIEFLGIKEPYATIGSCSWKETSTINTCSEENGKITVTYTATITPSGANLPSCNNQTITYPCSVSVKLPFFDKFTFLFSILGIAMIYALMKKR